MLPAQEREQEGRYRCVEDRPERREPYRHEDDDEEERAEVVAVAPEEVTQRWRLDLHAACPEPAGVGLDGEDDAEVVKKRGDEGVDKDFQVADPQKLGDDERRRPEGGRREYGSYPRRRQNPAARLARVAAATQDRPGHRGERNGRRRPRAGDGAEEKSGERRGAARARARVAEGREAHVYKVLARARVLQDRAVDREQDDVGSRDVQRHPEEPFETHVGLPHDAVRPVADVTDPGPVRYQGAQVRVSNEGDADEG